MVLSTVVLVGFGIARVSFAELKEVSGLDGTKSSKIKRHEDWVRIYP